MTHWTPQTLLKIGDTCTFAGQYQRRTLWQWLTRKPRKPKVFEVVASGTSRA